MLVGFAQTGGDRLPLGTEGGVAQELGQPFGQRIGRDMLKPASDCFRPVWFRSQLVHHKDFPQASFSQHSESDNLSLQCQRDAFVGLVVHQFLLLQFFAHLVGGNGRNIQFLGKLRNGHRFIVLRKQGNSEQVHLGGFCHRFVHVMGKP